MNITIIMVMLSLFEIDIFANVFILHIRRRRRKIVNSIMQDKIGVT